MPITPPQYFACTAATLAAQAAQARVAARIATATSAAALAAAAAETRAAAARERFDVRTSIDILPRAKQFGMPD